MLSSQSYLQSLKPGQIDSLTQMLNREGWMSYAQTLLTENTTSTSDLNPSAKAILFIDLDRFKWVNDSLGHDSGDELLRQVSEVIKNGLDEPSTEEEDSVLFNLPGRMGGDEFVALVQSPNAVVKIEQIANRLIETLSQPFNLRAAEVEIGASIGIARYPQDSHKLEDLLKFADLAMYRAKHSGRNQLVFYQPEMIRQIEYRREVQSYLRKALNEELLDLCYEPIYDLHNKQVHAIEASLDFEQCEWLATLDQSSIFAIADESQVAIQLSQWMIEQGLKFIQKLSESEVDIGLVMPVRPGHFHQKDFVSWLEDRLEEYEIAPENLILSLNETCLNVQRFPVEKQLTALSKLGVEISAQSYGSGNLSPLRLHDWPINRLHLSSMFVSEITHKRSMEAIATALIHMGLTLNKKVIAYGVRTADQQSFLMSQQCVLMQGPYFGEPLSVAETEVLLMKSLQSDDEISPFEDLFLDDY